MEKCFAYLRVSDPSQIKKDGFTRQLKAIEQYAKAHKLKIVNIFKEQGVSGTTANRPALAEMIVSLEKNHHGVKTVVIEKLDRLARNLLVQEAVIRDFRKGNYNIISTAEGADLCGDDPTRKLIRQVMGAVAEYDKTMLVAKLRVARERVKALTGKCEGRKGYYETEQGRTVVRRIHALRRTPQTGRRRTLQKVADMLNNEGLLTLNGKKWTPQHVQQAYT
ncbi:MAG: recombinase family protein, partial [Bacteroidetes bacterium]|nr:recombinase family protein [Bacteroidota bacterium]